MKRSRIVVFALVATLALAAAPRMAPPAAPAVPAQMSPRPGALADIEGAGIFGCGLCLGALTAFGGSMGYTVSTLCFRSCVQILI